MKPEETAPVGSLGEGIQLTPRTSTSTRASFEPSLQDAYAKIEH